MSEPFELDLAAASLRADAADTGPLVEGLASWLEESVPALTEVQRKRAGLLDSRRLVTRISCRIGDEAYTLERAGAGVRTTRARAVRGITLKTESLGLGEWLARLAEDLQREAQLTSASMGALRELLT